MVTQKKSLLQTYEVMKPFQCPNTKFWHHEGTVIDLLPSEAEFLKLAGKIKLPGKKTTKELNNA
ncbi:hypothetical protein [Pseudoalteromonas sp. Of7M-16]|uniref:hypothetical protein n=1 Tax=Pseudoalteromonas sp. Of7M-16 TaxID=2917756 RepID=UPI001EF747EF|nr:hypothetical protein [Pseudoalteromonas sp. Of7M-16]MCG7551577.1 hypothetical protein [Pseudoalteromonas sp. Of7M-16]